MNDRIVDAFAPKRSRMRVLEGFRPPRDLEAQLRRPFTVVAPDFAAEAGTCLSR